MITFFIQFECLTAPRRDGDRGNPQRTATPSPISETMRRCDRANRTVKHGGPCKSPFNLPERGRKPSLARPGSRSPKKSLGKRVRLPHRPPRQSKTRNAMDLFKIINDQLGEIIELKCQAEADANAIRQLQNENYSLKAAQRQLEYELYFNSNVR